MVSKDKVVEHCISVDSILDLQDIYTEHEIILQTGEENVGWCLNADGTFTPPEA